jgi:hypothetical protein
LYPVKVNAVVVPVPVCSVTVVPAEVGGLSNITAVSPPKKSSPVAVFTASSPTVKEDGLPVAPDRFLGIIGNAIG